MRGIFLVCLVLFLNHLYQYGTLSKAISPSNSPVSTIGTGNGSSKFKITLSPNYYENTRGPPVLSEGKDKILAYVRDNVELECPIISYTHSLFEWYKGTERITELWERFKITDQGRLKIRSVTHEDSGPYTCRAINGFGLNQFEIQLAITGDDPLKHNYLKPIGKRGHSRGNNEDYSSPIIVKDQLPSEKILKVLKGDNLQLKCGAKGNPMANMTWFKDNETLATSKDNSLTLKLMNLTEKSIGLYKCVAENVFGKAEYEIYLQVTGSWQGAAEILELSPRDVRLSAGQNTTITCTARFESDTFQMLFWVKQVRNSTKGERIFIHDGLNYELLARTEIKEHGNHVYSTDLVLTNVTKKDSGQYTCAVAGLMGFNHSQVQIYVSDDPVLASDIQKEQKAAIQWAALWTIAFLVLAFLMIFCFSRVKNGCQSPLKKPHVHVTSSSAVVQQQPTLKQNRNPVQVSRKCPKLTTGELTLSQMQKNEVSQPLVHSSTLSSKNQQSFSTNLNTYANTNTNTMGSCTSSLQGTSISMHKNSSRNCSQCQYTNSGNSRDLRYLYNINNNNTTISGTTGSKVKFRDFSNNKYRRHHLDRCLLAPTSASEFTDYTSSGFHPPSVEAFSLKTPQKRPPKCPKNPSIDE